MGTLILIRSLVRSHVVLTQCRRWVTSALYPRRLIGNHGETTSLLGGGNVKHSRSTRYQKLRKGKVLGPIYDYISTRLIGKPENIQMRRLLWFRKTHKNFAPLLLNELRPRMQLFARALTESQLPAPTLPEVAVIGRSNVGKSSLLNELCGHSNRARVSSYPGSTEELHFYHIGTPPSLILVDLPGFGDCVAREEKRLQWTEFCLFYLKTRKRLKRVLLLIDAYYGLHSSDLNLLAYLEQHKISWQIIITKADTVKARDLSKRVYLVREEVREFRFCAGPILPLSAGARQGLDELRQLIDSLQADKKTISKYHKAHLTDNKKKIKMKQIEQKSKKEMEKKKNDSSNNQSGSPILKSLIVPEDHLDIPSDLSMTNTVLNTHENKRISMQEKCKRELQNLEEMLFSNFLETSSININDGSRLFENIAEHLQTHKNNQTDTLHVHNQDIFTPSVSDITQFSETVPLPESEKMNLHEITTANGLDWVDFDMDSSTTHTSSVDKNLHPINMDHFNKQSSYKTIHTEETIQDTDNVVFTTMTKKIAKPTRHGNGKNVSESPSTTTSYTTDLQFAREKLRLRQLESLKPTHKLLKVNSNNLSQQPTIQHKLKREYIRRANQAKQTLRVHQFIGLLDSRSIPRSRFLKRKLLGQTAKQLPNIRPPQDIGNFFGLHDVSVRNKSLTEWNTVRRKWKYWAAKRPLLYKDIPDLKKRDVMQDYMEKTSLRFKNHAIAYKKQVEEQPMLLDTTSVTAPKMSLKRIRYDQQSISRFHENSLRQEVVRWNCGQLPD